MLKALKVLEMRYYGTIYGSYFLGCSSIGTAKIEGIKEEVFITWGRELKGREVKEFTTGNSMTWPQLVYYPTTKNEKSIKKYEMLIPFSVIELIKPAISVMTRNEKDDKEKIILIHHPEPKKVK
tara:strand:- start:631 stop:1002 length:372 start_codon:yes stop_codon:yes gene_type:complete